MAHFVSPTVRETYASMSIGDLRVLLTRIEEAGKKAKEAMATNDGNRIVSMAIVAGRFQDVSAATRSYNSCRGA